MDVWSRRDPWGYSAPNPVIVTFLTGFLQDSDNGERIYFFRDFSADLERDLLRLITFKPYFVKVSDYKYDIMLVSRCVVFLYFAENKSI